MQRGVLRTHNVIAMFRDLELAREGIHRLREAGFDDTELTVLGEAPDGAVDRVAAVDGQPVGGDVARHTIAGSAGGGALGAILGAAGTAAIAAIPGVGLLVGPAALIGAISGAVAGGTVGSLLEGEAALRSASGWGQAFESLRAGIDGGGIAVGVHTEEEDRAEEARRLLEATEAVEVHRLNQRGERTVGAGAGDE